MDPKPATHHTNLQRIIGKVEGSTEGPTCIFFGGIHGNEPSGVIALQEVLENLRSKTSFFKGTMLGICGNLKALQKGVRYHQTDLNRLWTEDNMLALKKGTFHASNEDEEELIQLYELLNALLKSESSPYYLFDLHTTSSKTVPFITVNDSLLNRKFTELYPVPLILGIEEYLEGPMLSYFNEKGYVSFGFEGGEHQDPQSVICHKSFIYLSLAHCGCISKDHIPYKESYQLLEKSSEGMSHFYEIYERYEIFPSDHFKMNPGYQNFQPIYKGDILALNNENELRSKEDSIIFMPLYQSSGNDGYFLIKKTNKLFLKLSSLLRKLKIDRILPFLPGIQWVDQNKDKLSVNLKVARFLAKPFLHLLGYRARKINEEVLIIKNRESASRTSDYFNENWYQES